MPNAHSTHSPCSLLPPADNGAKKSWLVHPVADRGSAAEQLHALFARNGYVRWQNPDRKTAEGCRRYKKGDEVRLTANSEAELEHVRELLQTAGFRVGRPYRHHGHQYRQPIYGRRQVARFVELIELPRVAGETRLP